MREGEGSDFPPKKAQLDGPVACSLMTETPAAKKLARQLDFTAFDSSASATVVLPEHPQTQTVTVTVAVAAQSQPPQVLVRPVVAPPPPPPPPPPSTTTTQPLAQAPVRFVQFYCGF